MLCWKFYSILCQMIWILTFPAEYRISFAERVAIQTIQLTSEDYQHLKYWVYPKYRECSIFWVTWYPMIFKTEPGWVLEKVSRSGRVLGTHWALLMTRGRMNSSEVDLLWVCEEHHGCSLSSSSLTSKANVVRSQEDSHLSSIVYVVFDFQIIWYFGWLILIVLS